jgi:hypothetical protein
MSVTFVIPEEKVFAMLGINVFPIGYRIFRCRQWRMLVQTV